MSNVSFYRIRPYTNLHAGGSDAGLGVIDNYIQRDPTTGMPCIYSSSLKGAIKQSVSEKLSRELMRVIFGSDADINKTSKEDVEKNGKTPKITQQGASVFFSAQLLALAVPCDKTPFVLLTSRESLRQYLASRDDEDAPLEEPLKAAFDALIKLPSEANTAFCLSDFLDGAYLRSRDEKLKKIDAGKLTQEQKNLIQGHLDIQLQNLCLADEEVLIELCSNYNLPVLARNVLDDGDSKNLFYEQVLPRESLLYFWIRWKDTLVHQKPMEMVLEHNSVQIGGNASVGYGFTRIKKLS